MLKIIIIIVLFFLHAKYAEMFKKHNYNIQLIKNFCLK